MKNDKVSDVVGFIPNYGGF